MTAAAEAKAREKRTIAEREEDARWSRCNGCDMTRRLIDTDDGKVIVEHNRWDAQSRQMTWCEGSSRPPQTIPAATFEAEDN
jgi:hypothetical protein